MFVKNVPQIATYTSKGILKPDNTTVVVDANGVLSLAGAASLVPWTTGTDDEIEAMLTSYYAGDLSLQDVQSVQAIGDVREANSTDKVKMQVAAHTSTYTADDVTSVPAQTTITQWIIDFNHDTLVTAEGSITKALVTIQTRDTIGDDFDKPFQAHMNSDSTNAGGQGSCGRRTYCNSSLYNALGFKTQIKQVVKSYQANGSMSSSNDYTFLPSYVEVFGSEAYGKEPSTPEGSQYPWFATKANRMRAQGQNDPSISYPSAQWLRTPACDDDEQCFLGVGIYGDPDYQYAGSHGFNIAPCVCL